MNENPESLDKLNSFPITYPIQQLINGIADDVNTEKQKRAWWDQSTDQFINMRYGIRNQKTFPWPNCANYVIPLIDTDINRIKPAYAGLIDVTPVVMFEPFGDEDMEAAENKEIYFDWLLKAKMDFNINYLLSLDYILEQGIVIWKTTWKYTTADYTEEFDLSEFDPKVVQAIYDPIVTDDILAKIIEEEFKIDVTLEENVREINKSIKKFRNGQSKFRLNLKEIKDDRPEAIPCSLRYDITFPVETTDLNQARFIDYKFQISKNNLKIAMRDEKYKEYSDGEINAWSNDSSTDERRKRNKTTNAQPDQDNIWLHETCVWHDINEDGIAERCIATWPDNDPESVLRFIELPYDHGMWPYVAVKREINGSGLFDSRGIPALDSDFQNGISTAFNQSVDNGTITNTPQVVVKENALVNTRNLRYIPGERVTVRTNTADYETRVLGNGSQGFLLQSAQYLKSWANERIGNISSGLTADNNQAGQGQQGQKTAREINLVEQVGTEIQSLDLQVHQHQMALLYYQIDALDNQFGNQDEISFVSQGQAQKLSRKEIQGKFKYVPNGRLDNSNPAMRLSKAFNLLKMFLNDPDIKQRELKKIVLDDFDIKIARKIFKSDEEKAQEQQAQAQGQQGQKTEAMQTSLMLKKADSAIELQRIQGEAQVDIQKYLAESLIDVHEAALLVPIEGQVPQTTKPKTSSKSR